MRRCIHKATGDEYAVKIVDKYSEKGESMKGIDVVSQIRAEIAALSRVAGHPNISKYQILNLASAFYPARGYQVSIINFIVKSDPVFLICCNDVTYYTYKIMVLPLSQYFLTLKIMSVMSLLTDLTCFQSGEKCYFSC